MTEVTPVQPQQPGRKDNKIWRKRISELINHKAVCRTAPATPGLLRTQQFQAQTEIAMYLSENLTLSYQ